MKFKGRHDLSTCYRSCCSHCDGGGCGGGDDDDDAAAADGDHVPGGNEPHQKCFQHSRGVYIIIFVVVGNFRSFQVGGQAGL